MRQRGKNKTKQQPTPPEKVWTKEKDRQAFHKTPLAAALADFETFREELIPMLRRDVLDGMAPDEMRTKYAALIQARQIMTAISSADDSKAGAAAKDILDRSEGKPTERQEHVHKFEDMKEEELDALLLSEAADLREIQKKFQ